MVVACCGCGSGGGGGGGDGGGGGGSGRRGCWAIEPTVSSTFVVGDDVVLDDGDDVGCDGGDDDDDDDIVGYCFKYHKSLSAIDVRVLLEVCCAASVLPDQLIGYVSIVHV